MYLNRRGKMTFLNSLGLLFIGLKLANIIFWPWGWVLFPLWGPLFFTFILGIVDAIVTSVKGR